MAPAAQRRSTYAEYLVAEASGKTKQAYMAGAILAMASGTIEHGRLMSRLTVLMSATLAGRPCAEQLRLEALDIALAVDDVYVDGLGAIVE